MGGERQRRSGAPGNEKGRIPCLKGYDLYNTNHFYKVGRFCQPSGRKSTGLWPARTRKQSARATTPSPRDLHLAAAGLLLSGLQLLTGLLLLLAGLLLLAPCGCNAEVTWLNRRSEKPSRKASSRANNA
jgi:hypothetical protein